MMAEFTEDEPSQHAPNVKQTDPSLHHDNMATSCLRVMSEYLKPNICGLSSPGIDRSTIPKDKISSCISETLVYACTNWVAHLQTSNATESLLVTHFLERNILHWLEVLSRIGRASESILMIETLTTMAEASLNPQKATWKLILCRSPRLNTSSCTSRTC